MTLSTMVFFVKFNVVKRIVVMWSARRSLLVSRFIDIYGSEFLEAKIYIYRRHDTQYNDIQHNDTQHSSKKRDIHQNDTQLNTEHCYTEYHLC